MTPPVSGLGSAHVAGTDDVSDIAGVRAALPSSTVTYDAAAPSAQNVAAVGSPSPSATRPGFQQPGQHRWTLHRGRVLQGAWHHAALPVRLRPVMHDVRREPAVGEPDELGLRRGGPGRKLGVTGRTRGGPGLRDLSIERGRAALQLKSFGSILVPAHATRTVTLALPLSDLSVWTGSHMTVIPGDYDVSVGTSSADLPSSASVSVP
jgi:hypothetical protein